MTLGTLAGDTQSLPYGMNNSGQIVGLSYNGNNPALNQGFLFQNGTMTSLTSLLPPSSGWTLTEGMSINDRGQILAFANDPSGRQHEILLTPPIWTPRPIRFSHQPQFPNRQWPSSSARSRRASPRRGGAAQDAGRAV